eukprot:m.77694 g.77694  ORF g.77694 m.77694 type:complete len:208 (-) comp14482_c0_seq5:1050-1673(-)
MIEKLHEVAKVLDEQSQEHHTCTDSYIICFEQISQILGQFGMVFSIVTKDVDSKLAILRELRASNDNTHKYLERMMQHEVDNNITILKGGGKSGSRTLLRLHRALEFFIRFLEKLLLLQDADSAAAAAVEAYSETLQQHHSFLIRSSVWLALKSLSTKAQLMTKIKASDSGGAEHTDGYIREVCDWLQDVYANVDACFHQHGLHSLP